ncbi:TerB family tellurite resistance protein [Pseudaquabacterium pictum]|uniref:TerB family tellurite resistance protein n=1 Tax=Pseudaquabacterium pictum TaxID=2315236 RepID=UPI0010F6D704|nr:TerB family tellurite resistance protein [Rubrivivax pictus]
MSATEHQAILTISLLAAFADGQKHARERDAIKRIADGLGQAEGVHMPTLYQDVLLKRVGLDSAVPQLASADARLLAYEMAVCVCDADGVQSTAEQAFLADLGRRLGVDGPVASGFAQQAEALAQAPIPASVPAPAAAPAAAVDNAALDKTILNAAILNGALELLPENLSTLAIIPLQMKLVYNIGQAHGYQLDSGHVKDFLATVGVGLTSQYLEQAGRKLLGGLLGKVGGGLLGGLGKQAVSSGMSFATTYALGHVAKRYYAGGRVLSAQMLKDAYAGTLQQAQGLQAQYLPAMREQARTLDTGKLLAMVRGGR